MVPVQALYSFSGFFSSQFPLFTEISVNSFRKLFAYPIFSEKQSGIFTKKHLLLLLDMAKNIYFIEL